MDVDQIKEANPIEDVIEAEFPLRGRGRWLRSQQHDSLVVDTHGQAYFWNSVGEQGDVITWVMKRRSCDFKAGVEWLCQRAGLPAPQWGQEDSQAAQAKRIRYEALTVAGRHFVRTLRGEGGHPAQNYCYSRGWTDETIRQAGLGYADGDLQGLRGEFSMHEVDLGSGGARAALGIRGGMLVYPHVEGGRVVYISARSVEGKRHYNPPSNLVGERRVYVNWIYSPRADEVVVVEGQADAVSLGQWGVAAVALAGTSVGQVLLKRLARHERVYVALDQDEAGVRAAREIADALGPLTRVVTWPSPAKDANEWLQSLAGEVVVGPVGEGEGDPLIEEWVEETAGKCGRLLAAAPMWVEVLAREIGGAEGGDRERGLRRVFGLMARMDDFAVAAHRERLAKLLGLGIRQFGGMLKAAREEAPTEAAGGEPLVTIETVGGMLGGNLCELVYQPPEGNKGTGGGKTLFAVRREDGTIEMVPHVDVENVRYVPIPPHNRVLSERVVQFPTALGEEKTIRELVRMIQRVIHHYVDVDVFYETLMAYYVLFSWMYDAFNTVPYLRALGDAGTGKSRLIQVVGAMCYRPIYISGAATISPVFRILDRYRGTLVLDEADFRMSDEASDFIKILNTGYQRTQGTVLRAGDRNSGFEPEVFVVYGPKLVATRKKFQDWALESRCLTKEMGGPTTREDIPIDLPMSFWREEAPAVRNLLLRYRLQHWQSEIELDYSGIDMSVEPRLNQVTVALVTLVNDEDLRQDLQAFVREYNRQLIVERGMTLVSKVLEVLVAQWRLAEDEETELDLSLKTIGGKVNDLIDWENWGNVEDEEDRGRRGDKRVTPKKIGSVVRNQLHLRTERGPTPRRGYQVIWDGRRVEGLRKRFGLDDEALVQVIGTLYEIEMRRGAGEPVQDELEL